jgi:hypothetical protein
MKWWSLAFVLTFVTAARAEDAAPAQQHDPDQCVDQKQCLVDWYAEYKTGILAEFLAFRDMETEAANAIRLHSGKAAEALLNNLAPKHLYRHDQWRFAKPSEALTAAGIDLGEYDALLSSCRTSILKMKFALIETDGGQYAKAAKDQSNYQENARACEKRFQLPVKGQ